MSNELPRSPAVARNRDPILAILRRELRDCLSVLEIGSGSGEHAVYFARGMDWLEWQPSDRPDKLPGIEAWLSADPQPNLRPPIPLDVGAPPDAVGVFDALFSANTAHIMSIEEVGDMFSLAGRVLRGQGKFCLYGPFNRHGRFTSESNARFDVSLRSQDVAMGIRDIETLDGFAADAGLERQGMHPMPANNFLVVWIKPAGGERG